MARTNPAERINRDRWRVALVALDRALRLGEARIDPDFLAPMLKAQVLGPLSDALRGENLGAYAGMTTDVAEAYIDFLDAPTRPECEPGLGSCQWFTMCVNEAVGMVAHPFLGRVPTCARCAQKANQKLEESGVI